MRLKNITSLKIAEWFISINSILGCIILSYNIPEAWFVYLAANIVGIPFFWKQKMKGMVVMNLFFLFGSLNGIYQNFIG